MYQNVCCQFSFVSRELAVLPEANASIKSVTNQAEREIKEETFFDSVKANESYSVAR